MMLGLSLLLLLSILFLSSSFTSPALRSHPGPAFTPKSRLSATPPTPISTLKLPGARSYISKHMWSGSTYNPFESAYLSADLPALGQSSSGLPGFLSRSPVVTAALIAYGPPIGCVIVIGGFIKLCYRTDRMIKAGKEKAKQEEIEMYGEVLQVDATPISMEDEEKEGEGGGGEEEGGGEGKEGDSDN